MESHSNPIDFGRPVDVTAPANAPQVLVICEHASNHIPAALKDLGLDAEARCSHIAWDPGALGVAQALAHEMQGVLVAGRISRLVYDCNRPPEAASAMPTRSEATDVPGNMSLSAADRAARISGVYAPFCDAVSAQINRYRETLDLMVTIHSFTPVFHDVPREVEIGVLHGQDDRVARAMMDAIPESTTYDIRLNAPYAASDGVAHTLDLHGAGQGLANVMIEIRNDLITTAEAQSEMAAFLAPWIAAARTVLAPEETGAQTHPDSSQAVDPC